ncbi:hypothetical protein AAV94_06350 [Lampropedia cohaerens]|uniref:Solute-binding protein family 5 domain-containing protein n=1 Tax=Lampropedia cohaerens TaxID=1610491 RepID=A0A0U1Q011_9BURK|nr:ABC transporter substrate-binding protein [Lampropedia cohaerens]KKW68104.1 hypothetical protein AAV94_06350 [Lampropedia cohaerens]
MRRRDFVRIAPAGALAGLLAQAGVRVVQAQGMQALTIAFPHDVPTWDPIAFVRPHVTSLFKCVFDQPLEYNADSVLSPGVITAYRWTDDSGLILELDFRDDVYFHNGDKFTSEDFKFTFLDRPRADKSLQLGYVWGVITDIETPTPTKAIVHFSAPMVTAPQYLGFAGSFLVPKKYFEEVGKEAFIARPVGTGPYRLIAYEADSRMVLEAFEGYWGGVPSYKRVIIQIVKDSTARVSAVQAGQVDLTYGVPMREAVRLGGLPNLTAELSATVDTYIVHMANHGVLQDRNVRLAMHHAIDKQALSKALFNNVAKPVHAPSPPGTPSYDDTFTFAYDPARAAELLQASGYSTEKPVAFTFYTTNGAQPSDFDLARALVQMWKRVGIEANLEVIDGPQFQMRAAAGEMDGPMLWCWTNSSADPELYSGSYLNPSTIFSVWRSNDIKEKLDPLLVEVDYEKRIAQYKDFEAWVVGEGYSLPLLQGVATVVRSNAVRGYVPFSNGWVLPAYWKA